jgi:hypothetical protein
LDEIIFSRSNHIKKKSIIKRRSVSTFNSKYKDENEFGLVGESEMEKALLYDAFYSNLYLDEFTGALYFNQDEFYFYTKCVAKLINFYSNEKRLNSKLIKVDAYVYPLNRTESIYLNLIFKQPSLLSHFKKHVTTNYSMAKNRFLLNSNNLLDLFQSSDEFFATINIQENSPTWLALEDYDVTVNEGQLINVRKYFESKLDKRKSLAEQHLLDNLRYYVPESDDYFYMEDNVNGILLTKPSIQFDYEVERSYFTRVMIVKYNNNNNDEQKFVYWLDLSINVLNVVDEPFVCSQPVYYVNVDENEIKNFSH